MIGLLRDEAARYAVSIRAELTEDLSLVAGDRVQLEQVLMNLMVNSIEAMNEGGDTGAHHKIGAIGKWTNHGIRQRYRRRIACPCLYGRMFVKGLERLPRTFSLRPLGARLSGGFAKAGARLHGMAAPCLGRA
jgi:hypothetical protein